jgi:hypothetical protein
MDSLCIATMNRQRCALNEGHSGPHMFNEAFREAFMRGTARSVAELEAENAQLKADAEIARLAREYVAALKDWTDATPPAHVLRRRATVYKNALIAAVSAEGVK